MNRSQILLEDWQYRQLQRLTVLQKRGLSEIVREWISEKLADLQKGKQDPLLEAASMLKGKVKGKVDIRNIDQEIYRYSSERKK